MLDMADPALPIPNNDLPQTADALNATLDDLWSKNLSLLDQYQHLRQQLSDNISTGHLNLARANFSSPNRVHYGRDYYDERMQASLYVSGKEGELFQIVTTAPPISKVASSSEIVEKSDIVPKSGLDDTVKEEGDSKTEKGPSDPLNWFGILRPPALRASQVAFQDAIAKVSRLASLDMEMKNLEIEIRRTRKKLKKLE